MTQKIIFSLFILLTIILLGVNVYLVLTKEESSVSRVPPIISPTPLPGSVSVDTQTTPLSNGSSTSPQPDFQPMPQQQTDELTKGEIQARFKRLYEREKRLGLPVKRGTPLMLDVRHLTPPVSVSE